MIVVGGGATGVGVAVDAASARLRRAAAGAERFRQRHLQPQHQAGPRRRALPRTGQHLARDGSAEGARPAAAECSAPGAQSRLRRAQLRLVGSAFYGVGLKLYNLLAGKYGFGPSRILSREETLERLPTIKTEGLRGGVIYFDGQFDDARLLINLVATALRAGRHAAELRAR